MSSSVQSMASRNEFQGLSNQKERVATFTLHARRVTGETDTDNFQGCSLRTSNDGPYEDYG
jgi:hypothetical protein